MAAAAITASAIAEACTDYTITLESTSRDCSNIAKGAVYSSYCSNLVYTGPRMDDIANRIRVRTREIIGAVSVRIFAKSLSTAPIHYALPIEKILESLRGHGVEAAVAHRTIPVASTLAPAEPLSESKDPTTAA